MSQGKARRSFTTDYDDDSREHPLLSPAADEEIGSRSHSSSIQSRSTNQSTSSSSCFSTKCQCRVSQFGCITTTSVFALLLGVAALFLLNVVGPTLAQLSIKHSTLNLIRCTMQDADNKSIALDCHVRLDNAGGIPAILRSFPVDVLHVRDNGVSVPELFGRMIMPETVVRADEPTYIRLMSRLNVSDNAAFTRATAGVLQGNVGTWMVRGDGVLDASIGGASIPFHVHLEKEMLLPPTVLANVTAYNFVVTGSDEKHVYATASCSLLSVSVLELHSLGTMSFSLHAPLDGPDPGAYVGEITIPEFQVERGFNVYSNVTAKIMIDPNATMHDKKYMASARAVKLFFTKYAKGLDIAALLIGPTWIKSGSPFLLGLVEQNVSISNAGPFVSDMETSDIQIVEGTKTRLPATANGIFHSASKITAGALGAITFELQAPAGPSLTPFLKTVTIGTVTMPADFGVNPGKNSVVAQVAMIKDGSTDNEKAISKFVDQYAMGKSQDMQLFGPINHTTSMLNGFLTQKITAGGIANPNLVIGSVLTHSSVAGFKANGAPPTRGSDGLIRGAVAVTGNPFDAHIRMADVTYDIYLHEPIEYTIKNAIWTEGKDVHCPKTTKFSRSSFGKGMHMYPYLCPGESCDASKADQDYVDFTPKQQLSFLSPAYPMPDQIIHNPDGSIAKCHSLAAGIMPDFDCCYLTIFFASACRAISKGDAHFLTHTNGTMHLTVGEFQTVSSISQDSLSFTFEAALLDGWKILGVTEVPTCKDFTFKS